MTIQTEYGSVYLHWMHIVNIVTSCSMIEKRCNDADSMQQFDSFALPTIQLDWGKGGNNNMVVQTRSGNEQDATRELSSKENGASAALAIGWAETDITPHLSEMPVYIAGQFYVRLSEGVHDPLTATVWALQSGEEQAVFVSCDLSSISNALSESVRVHLRQSSIDLDPEKVIIHATHTHTGPETRLVSPTASYIGIGSGGNGIELDAQPVEAVVEYIAGRIAQAVISAWTTRAPGGIAHGLGHAIVGRNRRWTNIEGQTTMYGLNESAADQFSHIEGYEDHSVQLIATYDSQKTLTGLVVNVPCPSQEDEHGFLLSADYWHETRQQLRRRFGESLYILPQCSAAGDLTSHLLYDTQAEERMLALKGRTAREEIAHRIADAVGDILPYIGSSIDWTPLLRHRVGFTMLPMNRLQESDAATARRNAEIWRAIYEKELQKLGDRPELRKKPRWYVDVTAAYRTMQWHQGVVRRFEQQSSRPEMKVEWHTLRLSGVAMATVPFELYLDYGIQIKVRSPAVQMFLIQLAGQGTYMPSHRSVNGGGYGSVPASNPIGIEGGQLLTGQLVEGIRALWGAPYLIPKSEVGL